MKANTENNLLELKVVALGNWEPGVGGSGHETLIFYYKPYWSDYHVTGHQKRTFRKIKWSAFNSSARTRGVNQDQPKQLYGMYGHLNRVSKLSAYISSIPKKCKIIEVVISKLIEYVVCLFFPPLSYWIWLSKVIRIFFFNSWSFRFTFG